METLIDASQSTLAPGRVIVDNILLRHELVKGYGRKGISPRCMMKIDMQKAYDSVEWPFVEQVLRILNFPTKFIQWIMECITTVSYTILINGVPTPPFQAKKGLRGDIESIKILFNTFQEFSKALGLIANPKKCSIYFGGVDNTTQDQMKAYTGFDRGELPFRYLGVPLSTKRLSIAQCEPMLEKMLGRISLWTTKFLSYAGRAQLMRSVMFSMQTYWSQIFILPKKTDLGIEKVLIVDWDVHHGNGTQKIFWKDPRVLFFSVHRHDFGTYYPSDEAGSHKMIGEGPRKGYNINVPWENDRCGDADYLAVCDHVLIPVAKEFGPDIILISAGFDAVLMFSVIAMGDPLGGCCVSPHGYAVMLNKLLEFAGGKIVMALEGGYGVDSIANYVQACIEVLLQQKPIIGSSELYPFESTWRVIQAVREKLSSFWQSLSMSTPYIQVVSSDSEDEYNTFPNRVSQDLEKDIENVIQPFSDLKVIDGTGQAITISHTWEGRAFID